MGKPLFVSPKLDVRKVASPDDEGLRATAEYWLGAQDQCEYSQREFGVIAKKPNKIGKLPGGVTESLQGNASQCMCLAIEDEKEYVLSKIFLALNPCSSTVMMSHEGEVYELVKIIRGTVDYIEYVESDKGIRKERHLAGKMFYSVSPNREGIPGGFYHQLHNPRSRELSLMQITTIAEKDLGFKDGKPLEYGLNRPPNSYNRKSRIAKSS